MSHKEAAAPSMLDLMLSVQHCETTEMLMPLLPAQSHLLGGGSLGFVPFGAFFASNILLLKYVMH